MKKKKKLYKVLSANGQSQNGGHLEWSLPKGKKPGKWHRTKEAYICKIGLHLTTDPVVWWKVGCRVFEVEATDFQVNDKGDVVFEEDKCVAKRVRLTRELTQEELVPLGIIRYGEHKVQTGQIVVEGNAKVRAYDSSQVRAYDSSQVTAYDSSQVRAYDSSQVRAYDSSQVTAYDSSQVTAYGSSQVTAYGSSQVRAYGSSQVTAYGSSQVRAYDSSQVTAYDSSQVRAYDSSQVRAGGSSQVTAYDSSQVRALYKSIVTAQWGSAVVTLEEEAVFVDRRNGKPEIKQAVA